MQSHWGLELQHADFGGHTIQFQNKNCGENWSKDGELADGRELLLIFLDLGVGFDSVGECHNS